MFRGKLLVGICASALLTLGFAGPARAANFTVDSLGDDPDLTLNGSCDTDLGGVDNTPCTLRGAIQEANNVPGLDVITINVSGTIALGSQLINGTEQMTIDGMGSGDSGAHTIVDGNDLFRLMFFNHGVGVGAGTVTLKDLRLTDGNSGANDTGGAVRTNGDLTLTNVVATSNGISGAGTGSGGAISNTALGATLNITDSVISDNTISTTGLNLGGGISTAGPLNLTNSVVTGNTITAGTSAQGGGIAASAAHDIDSSTVSNNSVNVGIVGQGGGIFAAANAGTRSITNSTISGNTATIAGGGGAHLNADTTITNVTFKNNTGGSGGGGEGADLEQAANTVETQVQNTIFASTGACREVPGTASIAPATPAHNIDNGTTCGFGNGSGSMENTDPMIFLAQAGSPLHTIFLPVYGSPAIDNADPLCGGGLTTDQRGNTRPQGGAGNCDIGAVEKPYRTLTVSRTGTGTGTVTGTQIDCGGDCEGSFLEDTPGIVLTATPAAGSQFGAWSGCPSPSGNQCTLTLGNDTMVSASFDPIPSSGGGGGTTTTTTPPKKKCKKGKKLKKGKCVKKKKKRKKK